MNQADEPRVPSDVISSIRNSRLWRSFFRHGWPDNPLDRSLVMTTNLVLHLPGGLLLFYYVPSVERAYTNIVELQTSVTFGQLTRDSHRWAAHLMVLVVVLHMGRAFYPGACKPPPE